MEKLLRVVVFAFFAQFLLICCSHNRVRVKSPVRGENPVWREANTPVREVLDNGITSSPPITNFDRFVDSAREFYKLDSVEHVGSMFTFRTVLPHKDDTDERPTIVNRAGERIISVFSGKIPNCVATAEDVARIVA